MNATSKKMNRIPYKGKKGIAVSNRGMAKYLRKITGNTHEGSMKKALFGAFTVLVWMAAIFAVSNSGFIAG